MSLTVLHTQTLYIVCIYFLIYFIKFTTSEILFWGHNLNMLHSVAPSPLIQFNNEHLIEMLDQLKPRRVIVFVDNTTTSACVQRYGEGVNCDMHGTGNIDDDNELLSSTVESSTSSSIANQKLPMFRQLVENINTVYVPENMFIVLDNFTVVQLNGTDADKDQTILEVYNEYIKLYGYEQILALLLKPNAKEQQYVRRKRRDIRDDKLPDYGPALYYIKDKAMLYSSLYPVLKIEENETETPYTLKRATLQTADARDQIIRLIITFSLENASKVVLRFRFNVTNDGYWSLRIVELQDVNHRDWTLVTEQDIVAAQKFSYHCSGNTVFRNGSTSLTLTDIQVQPAPIPTKRFSDAYDCVYFTTAPIWSGLLVTALLGAALAFAIIAISNIRTMDRFDDPKGKTLTISVD